MDTITDKIRSILLEQTNRFLPRWLVFIKDIFILIFAFLSAYTLRYNFQITNELRSQMFGQMALLTAISIITFYFTCLYKGIIRHTGVKDALLIVKSVSFIAASLLLIDFADNILQLDLFEHVPYSILIIFYTVAVVLLIFTRFTVRLIYYWLKSNGSSVSVLIYGAGAAGIITKNVLISDNNRRIHVAGFVDDHTGKIGKTIEGVYVYSPEILEPKFLQEREISEIIFSIQKIDKDRKRELIENLLQQTRLQVKEIPPVENWISGQLSVKQISRVKIEDLLQRSEIQLNDENMHRHVKGKVVMVTGAAGSIGSEIVRQLCKLEIAQLIMVDQAETPLYDLELELRKKFSNQVQAFNFIIGNVGDSILMERIYKIFQPQVIYHAAAYKHVPIMENNPFEAVRVNVFGTKTIADLASKYQAERFVMVSTDKAVNPTNVMGATKRAAEIYIQSLNNQANNKTRYITTRFGNVLGSNGSVIPLFEKQIASGGPVTVTHPEITRYFMTIPEACQLVLEAGALGKGGEILMFDMGKPVRIADLAYNMIRLSGLEPGRDIQIVYSGLRPGEKLYEELLYDKELGLPTHHPKISIAKVSFYDFSEVEIYLHSLNLSIESQDKMELVARLKRMVPEFKSNNSVFQQLDKVN